MVVHHQLLPYPLLKAVTSLSAFNLIWHLYHHHHHQSLVPTMLGSATRIMFLHSDLSWAKSSDKLHFFISTLYYFHPCPLWPIPSLWWVINLHSQTFPYRRRYRHTLDMLKPSQTSFSNFISYVATPKCSRKRSFLILSFLFLPHIYLNILISATSILCICCFLIGQHFTP